MLGLIKLLAFTATAMILNHQANADSDHCHRVHTCRRRGNDKGTQFKLRVKTQGTHEGDHLIGKLMMTSIFLQLISKIFRFSSGPWNTWKTDCSSRRSG